MNLVRTLKYKKPVPAIVVGIDASSTAIAFSIFNQQEDQTFLVKTCKISLNNFPMNAKLQIISSFINALLKDIKIDYIFVEQPIYIQNPATSRILSQVSGHILGECLKYCPNVSEVTIANWKSFIGYKNVSKAEKEKWTREMGEKESKKMAASERKQRTIRIIHQKISGIDHVIDNDICDSIGIGLYGLSLINKGDLDGA